MPEEPLGFGTDAAAIFAVVQSVQGWTRVEVEGAVAGPLGKLIEDRMGLRTHIDEAVYYHMLQPVEVVRNQAVRVLTSADEELLDQATYDEFFSTGGFVPVFEATHGEVEVNAGAVVDGRVVSFVSGYQSTARYGEMSACTLAAYRSHGFAVAAGSIVAGYLQERGLIPIWSTEAGNPASMRVAEKLGFVEILPRRCFVVTER
jgi:predicted GNAT family acetyltransferase